MDSSDAQFAYMLPEIISNFRPKFEKHTLNATEAAAAIEQWLQETKVIAAVQLVQLFELISSMQIIQDLKAEAKSYKTAYNFNAIEQQFKLKSSLNFYEQQYVPLINQRVRNIIENSWNKAINETFDQMQEHLHNAGSMLNNNIWLESAADLPLSLEQALSEESHGKHLLMKTKGFSHVILKICSTLDAQLSCIVSEMNVLLEELASSAEDKLLLVDFLRTTAESHMTQLLSKLKSLNLQPEMRGELLFVLRCCVALFELCPHLKICFCQQAHWRQSLSIKSTAVAQEQWHGVCVQFESEIMHFWLQLLKGILQQIGSKQQLSKTISYDSILEDFAVSICKMPVWSNTDQNFKKYALRH